MFLYGQKWLYSGKIGCIRAKEVFFVQSSCSRSKVVVIGQIGYIWAKVVVFV